MSSDAGYLALAARLAMRAAGDVEPNPMVGAVLVRDGVILGMGHHRRFGGPHAEREALADCRRRGNDPRGATVYVTLEPCRHHGKQPPCTEALIEAGVGRVVFARPDPSAVSAGGAAELSRAGIACELCTDSPLATRISDPFIKRVTTGLPWVIAKWAQTVDGRMTVPAGVSPWISNAASLKRVHRLRARVDAIVTGIGTVLADDPLLTARGVRRVRRVARRVVVDPRAETPGESVLMRSAAAGPVTLITREELGRKRWETLWGGERPTPEGVEVLGAPGESDRIDVEAALRLLVDWYDVTNVMLECGPRLLGIFLASGLVDEAVVYIAPPTKGAGWLAGLRDAPAQQALAEFDLVREKPLNGDTEQWFRRRTDARGPA